MVTGQPSETGPVVIALAFDSRYVAPASATIRSCLDRHDRGELRFEVVHDASVSRYERQSLRQMCLDEGADISFHQIDEARLQPLPLVDRFGPIVWSRFFLAELLDDVPRVLYLDCDVLVLDSLRALWEQDLGRSLLAAVANVVEPAAREHVAHLGVEYPGGFFNSGVILFDLDQMRKEGSAERLVEFALSNEDRLVWPDQDALNVVFARRWHPLHPRWNAQNSFWSWREWSLDVFGAEQLDEAVNDPGIRHFEGPNVAKPWHYLSPVPHRDVYLQTLARTSWANVVPEDRRMMTRLIARLPRRWQLGTYRRAVELEAAMRSRSGRRRPLEK